MDELSNAGDMTNMTNPVVAIAVEMMKNTSVNNNNHSIVNNFWRRSDQKEILAELSPIAEFIVRNGLQMKLHYIGLVSNLLCILIFTRKQMIHRKCIFYLVFLAFSDLMYNFVSILPQVLVDLRVVKYHIFKVSDLSCFFYDYIQVAFHVYSVLITLFVTIDRFNHIYNPLKFNQKFIAKKTKIFVGLGLFVLSGFFALPHGYLFVYNEQEKNCDGRELLKTKIGNTTISYYQAYFTFTEPIIMWFIPGIVIVCMNIYVIYKIFQSKKMPRSTTFKNTFTNGAGAGGQGGAAGLPMLAERSTQPPPSKIYIYKNGPGNNKKVRSERAYYEAMAAAHGIDLELIDHPSRSSPSGDRSVIEQQPGQQQQNHRSGINANIFLTKFKFYFLCFIRTKNSKDETAVAAAAAEDNQYNLIEFGRHPHHHNHHTGGLGQSPPNEMNLKPDQRKSSIDEYILNKQLNNQAFYNLKKPLPRNASMASALTLSQSTRVTTLKYRILNLKNTKLSVNQISHYITIIILGFYFIVTTIPYGILLSIQNHFTIDLDNYLPTKAAYINNSMWRMYGRTRDVAYIAKLLFITNHCFNFFLYLLFNRLFRLTIMQMLFNLKKFFRFNV